MKTKNLISILAMVVIMIMSTTTLFGQESKVALGGSAYKVSDNNNTWGLRVNDQLVVKKDYRDFSTDKNAQFFAVEAMDGKMGVCDAKGNFVYRCEYEKTAISGGMILIYTNGKPKFYNQSAPTVAVEAKQTSITSIEDEIAAKDPGNSFNPTQIKQKKAVEKAKEVSAQAPEGAFSFRTNNRGKQELIIDSKVVYTAETFFLLSDVAFYNETGCWLFIISDRSGGVRENYGVLAIAAYMDNGKKVVDDMLTIPLEYSFISPHQKASVECTTWSGASKYLNWYGKPLKN